MTEFSRVQSGELTTADVLRFYYFAGLLFAGVKCWSEAVDAFTTCLSVPAFEPSEFQVASYRKYVLCSLIGQHAVRDT